MRIENRTPFAIKFDRDYVSDTWLNVSVTTKVSLTIPDGERRALQPTREQPPVKLPGRDGDLGEVYWGGEPRSFVEVTISGAVTAPEPGFTTRDLVLKVGSERRQLRVFGNRRWQNRDGCFEATPPVPALSIPMEWARAYGGRHRKAPGVIRYLNLPGPSTEISWPENPEGIGFHLEPEDAADKELPHFEDPEYLIRSPMDRPPSSCWAPMPISTSLRLQHFRQDGDQLKSKHAADPSLFTRMRTHAPPSLQFEGVEAGTHVELTGFDPKSPIQFTVPAAPFSWRVQTAGRRVERSPHLFWIQVDATKRTCAFLYWTDLMCPLIRGAERHFEQLPTNALVATLADSGIG